MSQKDVPPPQKAEASSAKTEPHVTSEERSGVEEANQRAADHLSGRSTCELS
jgi:hypothetical protein